MTWWETEQWWTYEVACGLPARTRALERAQAIPTQVIDLALPVGTLWKDVRRSYHSLIHRGEQDVGLRRPEQMDDFRVLHAEVAGRATRPAESWRVMRSFVAAGHLLLVGAANGQAFAAFYAHGVYGYYGHAASADGVPVGYGHAMVWLAMRELKLRNVRWLEMGYLDGSSRETFRRGFGGFAMTTDAVDRMVGAYDA